MKTKTSTKRTGEENYTDRVRRVLGDSLVRIDIRGCSCRHPQIGIEYTDFKPVGTVRKLLEESMPEVDFFEIERGYSNAALATSIMCRDDQDEDEDVRILTPDNRVMSLLDYMWDQCYTRDFTDPSWQIVRLEETKSNETANE